MRIKTLFRGLNEFLDIKEEREETKYIEVETLKIENLSYSYDYYNYQLKNINLEFKKGDKVLITGPSGAGKSTFVKCLTNYLGEYKGNIIINNYKKHPISFKNSLIYVGQDEKLFTETIKDNIVLDKENTTHFKEVSKITKVDEILSKRIEGENTPILEGSTNISAGEKARIILARALYLNPSVLIIDETLSHVNAEMETEILKKLLKLDNLTLFYITHRDKTKFFKKELIFRKDGSYEFRE